jgi:protein-disulfide isomerase-like protein with CxxC motif
MKHVFSVVGVGLAAVFVAVFFTGRVDSKHLTVVAPRVGMHADDLNALVPRIASQTGATLGTSRRVVYLLACSGVPTAATIETQARQAALITARQRMTTRQAAVTVLSGTPSESSGSPLKDC